MLLALLAIPISGVSFLGWWTGRGCWPLPVRPPEHKLAWENDRSFWHNMKNQLTEWTRFNARWFSKFFSCLFLVQLILNVILFVF
jgi:hypothetical protein